MKYFAILFVAFLADKTFARKTCCTKDTLDMPSLLEEYQTVVVGLMVPTFEVGDDLAAKFKNENGLIIGNYGSELVFNLQSQARDAGEELIDDIRRSYHALECSINMLIHTSQHEEAHIGLENALKNMTDQIQRFLKLKPGISELGLPVLPPYPEQQVDVVSRTTKRTAEELFLNFESTLASDLLQLYGYWTYIFSHSYCASQIDYSIIRKAFYDEILNCPVLGNYTHIVSEVFKKRDFIQHHVEPGIWKRFENAGDQVITISKNYCDSLKCDTAKNED